MLGTPDAWEQTQLQSFDRAVSAGQAAGQLELAEIVTEPQGSYLRYVKALPVQPLCLTCHGGRQSIPSAVQARLAAEYPHDRAIGYQSGEVRGAVSIKRPVN
jgi:hypothetical protein